jgi:hypothetical protein
MRRKMSIAIALMGSFLVADAQSRVFREVSEDIKSEFRPILQDQGLVGYSMLTQLEKASEDSFNYKLTIMDENLNDIGVVNFKDEAVALKSVAFENDLLAMVFVKTRLFEKAFRNQKKAKEFVREAGACKVVVKFMDLSGKVVKDHEYKAEPDLTPDFNYSAQGSNRFIVPVLFKNEPLVRNVSGKGFVLFYRDNEGSNNKMTLFGIDGSKLWQKELAKEEQCYILTSPENISLLSKRLKNDRHFTLKIMGTENGSVSQEIPLQDKLGNNLSVLDIGNDPVTNKPYIAGMILNASAAIRYETYNGYMQKGPFKGVYSVSVTGAGKNDVKKNFSYWKNGELKGHITSSGRLSRNKSMPLFNVATRDANGNFYFSGVSMVRKPKWGNITGAVVTAPTFVVPLFFLAAGTRKVRMEDAVVLKQDVNGKVAVNNTIDLAKSKFVVGKAVVGQKISPYFTKGYSLKGNDGQTNFLILDNPKEITIYNLTTQKVGRTINHKSDGILTHIGPAKDGHIMVYEYNKKEKSTRLSIEAL